jgi:DNA helicase-2/ATP-dependent DNA helicase PcrA
LHENSEDYEEERRLFYVGITRAKRKLYLLLTKSRLIYGRREQNPPSPFLEDLPEELLERRHLYFKKKKVRERQLNLWKD